MTFRCCIVIVIVIVSIAGCANQEARCNGRLRPINVPVSAVHADPESGR
jgi:hypothetical protein